MDSTKVTASQPKITGAIFRAAKGTALPTDATSTLAAAFKNLGYVSEEGVTNSNTASTEQTKAWGGDVVMDGQTDKPDIFKMKLIEALNTEVLKTVYGDGNVTGKVVEGVK